MTSVKGLFDPQGVAIHRLRATALVGLMQWVLWREGLTIYQEGPEQAQDGEADVPVLLEVV